MPNGNVNLTFCYNWAESPDSTLQALGMTVCPGNSDIYWNLDKPDKTGFNFNILWRFADRAELFGTRWIPMVEVAWAAGGGQTVQYYTGPTAFVMANVSLTT